MAKKKVEPVAKFKVGQIVRIDTESYRRKRERGNERYQRIVHVWLWVPAGPSTPKFGYSFMNGDECNEMHVKELTKKELGVL